MKKINKYFYALFVLVFSLSSCTDSFLDEPNLNAVPLVESFLNTDETQEALNAAYLALLNPDIAGIIEFTLMSDSGFPNRRSAFGSTGGSTEQFIYYNQRFNNNSAHVSSKWAALYLAILRANIVITALDNIEESTLNREEWENQMGQAKFLRGLLHFYVHSTYRHNGVKGDIPIYNFVPTGDYDIPVSKSEDVIKFFRGDLTEAYNLLPYNPEVELKGKATKGSALTILGTSHLYEKEYGLAKECFSKLVEGVAGFDGAHGYMLETDMSKMFTTAGEFNSESIFELSYSDLKPTTAQTGIFVTTSRLGALTASNNVGGNRRQLGPAAWLVDAYQKEKIDITDSSVASVTDPVTGEVRERSVSLRASAMITLVTDLDAPVYGKPNAASRFNFKGKEVSVFKKYTNHDIVTTENQIPQRKFKSGKNVILNRLSDVYLMYAEAVLEGEDDVDEALRVINLVRSRWKLQLLGTTEATEKYDGVTYTKPTLMDHLMLVERPLELSAEGYGIRWIDLRRWEIAKSRFDFLATDPMEVYSLEDFIYPTSATNTKTHKNSKIIRGVVSTEENSNLPKEFEQANTFYQVGRTDYFEIPLDEIIRNANINN